MSELLRELRVRVDARVKPLTDLYGDDAAIVRMARLVLQDAEEIERSLGDKRVMTAEAHERTGWAAETLQKYARAKLAGEAVPIAWDALSVEETPGGYVFVLGSIPPNPRAERSS